MQIIVGEFYKSIYKLQMTSTVVKVIYLATLERFASKQELTRDG